MQEGSIPSGRQALVPEVPQQENTHETIGIDRKPLLRDGQ